MREWVIGIQIYFLERKILAAMQTAEYERYNYIEKKQAAEQKEAYIKSLQRQLEF